MKLLLTSAGLTNKSISKALIDLVGKPPKDTKLAFIPTAANVEKDDKGWLIDDLVNVKKQKFISIDLVDISALPEDIWLPRLKEVDILLFGGGNTFHLMYWLNKSGLSRLLPELLKSRVYMGISAGSMIASSDLSLSLSEKLYYPDGVGEYKSDQGLGFVDFYIRPHFNSPHFPKVREDYLKETAKNIKETIYALDDNSAVKVENGNVDVVSEGKYLILNQI